MKARLRLLAAIVVIVILAAGGWLWATSGRESTDDAQVDANVTPMAARVGGTVINVAVRDNQQVKAGDVLVELDPRDFDVRVGLSDAPLHAAALEYRNVDRAGHGIGRQCAGRGEANRAVFRVDANRR